MPWTQPSTNHAKRTHGQSYSREYTIWRGIIRRCHDATDNAYRLYGGRGIYVCDRWRHDFMAFRADMGSRPSLEHSIDRIDNDGPYSPDNCRWATRAEQMNNTRMNHTIDFDGLSMSVSEWARAIGISVSTLNGRIRRGWPLEKALRYKADAAPRKPRAKRIVPPKLCACGAVARSRGMCGTHYASARDTGLIVVAKTCACGRPHYAKGECRKCYAKRWWAAKAQP